MFLNIIKFRHFTYRDLHLDFALPLYDGDMVRSVIGQSYIKTLFRNLSHNAMSQYLPNKMGMSLGRGGEVKKTQ